MYIALFYFFVLTILYIHRTIAAIEILTGDCLHSEKYTVQTRTNKHG